MGTTITFRRGENDPTSGSGLTLAEPAFNTTLKTFHIGLGHGVTAAWVGAPISGSSADIAAGITYKIPSAAAVKNYIGGLCYGNTGAPTITQYVSSFNGLTGAVGGVCAAQANTFTALQSFNSGVSCDSIINSKFLRVGDFDGVGAVPAYVDINSQQGRITSAIDGQDIVQHTTTLTTNYVQSDFLSGISASGITTSSLYVYGNAVVQGNMTVSGGVTFTISENVLIEDNIITLNSNVTGSPSENAGVEIERGASANVQLLWNESSDKWTFTNDGSTYYDLPTSVVTSFNGNTGAVTGASLGANTFTGLNTFNSGISASGITTDRITLSSANSSVIGVSSGPSSSIYFNNSINSIDINSGSFGIGNQAQNGWDYPYEATIQGDADTGTISLLSEKVEVTGLLSVASGLSASGGVTIGGNLSVTGNFTVSGGVTFTTSETVLIEDNIITLNSNVTGSPSENAGIEIERGTSANVQLLWNESSDKWTFTNDGSTYYDLPTSVVTSFNGNTGAVTGASLGANTFTGLNTFNAGVSATGLTVGGREGIEITRRLPIGAILGEVNFIKGLSAELRVGNISGSVMVFNGSTASVFSPNYSLTISKGGIEGNPISGDYAAAVRFDTATGFNFGTATLAPISGYTTDRTINLPNASGTVALTSQLMGAVNGSTAATTAVTSFNGLTGAVQGVSSFNGGTGAVTGASLGANTFTALNTFNSGISGDINISSTNATGNMYLLMASGAGVTAVFMDNTTTPLVYQPFQGNLGLKGITCFSGSDYLHIKPTEIRATNSVTPSAATFYFIAEGGNYFQSPALSAIGDIALQNSALCLSVDPASRTMTWGDGVFLTGITSGHFGVNRSPSGMCADYAVEINSPTGKGVQLIYNDYTGAASNWVNMDVSSGGNFTVRPSGGLATVTGTLNVSAGLCAAGGTFSGDIAVSGTVGVSGGVSADAFILAGGGIKALTGTTYTFLTSDNGKIITMNNASGITAEVPSGLPTGFNCTVIQLGSGRVGFTGASGVTLNSYGGLLKISGQHGAVTVVSYSSNVYNIAGTLST